jgi:hypothetical protein
MAAKQYAVTGAYVTVKTMTVDGVKVIGLHRGAPVPADVDPAHLQHLLAHDLVAEVGQAAKADDMPEVQRAQLDANEAAKAGQLEAGARPPAQAAPAGGKPGPAEASPAASTSGARRK